MNIIYVNHGSYKDYVFRVPDDLVKHIHKGDIVAVETMHGVAVGVCKTGIINGEGALDKAAMDGAYSPLKPVIGKLYPELKNAVIRKLVETLMDSHDDDLPF
jgi:hypothetical protein